MSLARLLAAWPESRVLADDPQFLVVDKLAGIPVHGGDERALDDLIGRLRARDAARGGSGYFGVHQRLDKEVSGLLFLNRNPADNRLIAEETAARRIERRYLALVAPARAARALGGSGTLEHQLAPTKGGVTRVVKVGGQRAVTHYRVRDRTQDRALVSVRLETGRKHQIRAQLAHIGYPVVGDALYGGAPAPRLMLHCEGLRLPAFAREFSCAPPDYLMRWYESPGSRSIAGLAGLLVDAGCLRWQLAGTTEAFRLVNDSADLMPGVTVDVYGDYAALSLASDAAFERRDALAEALLEAGARGVYLKTRVRADLRRQQASALAPEAPLAGTPTPTPELCVREGQLKLAVDLADGLSTGLFVDQRDNRARVGAHSRGFAVLNLFAYTCSFSVAAALGGAREVVSVDLSKRALERGRKNFELNGLDPKAQRFIAEDALKWLERAARRGERFDLAIVDPPSFSSQGKGTFSVAKRYVELVCAVLRILGPAGTLLAVTNHKKTSTARLRAMLLEAAERAGRPVASLRSLKSPIDCPDTELGPHPSKSAWLRLE